MPGLRDDSGRSSLRRQAARLDPELSFLPAGTECQSSVRSFFKGPLGAPDSQGDGFAHNPLDRVRATPATGSVNKILASYR